MINVAILGQGRSGRDIHGAYIKKRPELYRVAAVVDPLPERRARAAEEWPGADIYENHTQIYGREDIALVINATPSHKHAPVTLDLLSHGFNVLTEKPFARYPYEIDLMIRESQKSGKLLAPFQQSRFCAYYQKLIEVIQSGVLGRIVQIAVRANSYHRRWDWQTLQENNAGSLLNTGPHAMDQVLNLLGFPADPKPTVTAAMDRVNTYGDAEDFVKVLLKTPGLPTVDYEISCCDPFTPYIFHVQGSCGAFTCTADHATWRYFDPKAAPAQRLIRMPLVDEEGLPCYCAEILPWVEEAWQATAEETNIFDHATHLFYQSVLDALLDGKPLAVTPQQVRLQIEIMAQCHEQNAFPRIFE